jgi:hypothetical protein
MIPEHDQPHIPKPPERVPQPQKAPDKLKIPRETSLPANQQEKTTKTAIHTPPNLFRLETTPFLYFVNFTRSFN